MTGGVRPRVQVVEGQAQALDRRGWDLLGPGAQGAASTRGASTTTWRGRVAINPVKELSAGPRITSWTTAVKPARAYPSATVAASA